VCSSDLVILKKPNKSDNSAPKSYRIIALLNCLGKISEKVIATRLLHLAECDSGPKTLLQKLQIGGRKQKSAIDAAMMLTHFIQSAKWRKEATSVLFLDVQGAFDHVALHQL